MFLNKPWYDELYTYYSFISRGSIYSAIHWPLPNNHIGYSVISGLLVWIPNSYIRLRAVSVVAALFNIALVYYIAGKIISKNMGIAASAIYFGANLVNSLSFQGRGYTLSTTCMLLSIFAIIKIYGISNGFVQRRYYFLFALGLVMGLYILPSSVYWVLPVCFFGGILLLADKRCKELTRLIISALTAAFTTVFLYGLVWLAIGANLLSKDINSIYYGLHQIRVLLKAPFSSAKAGIDYMLATPYIQSIDRTEAVYGMPEYFRDFFDNCYGGMGRILFWTSIIIAVYGLVVSIKKKGKDIGALLVSVMLFTLPVLLVIQSVHPYKRVLSFVMVPVALGICIILDKLPGHGRWGKYIVIPVIGFVAFQFTTYPYRAPLADRENKIYEALEKIDAKQIDSIYYTDDYQKYVLKFYYDITPQEEYLPDAQYVLMPEELMDKETDNWDWPLLMGYDRDFIDTLDKYYEIEAATGHYTVFRRDKSQ